MTKNLENKRRGFLLSIVMALTIFSPSVHSEMVGRESIEWIVTDSDLIVRGWLKEAVKLQNFEHPQVGWYVGKVKVEQVLKGNPLEEVSFIIRDLSPRGDAILNWKDDNIERIFCLVKAERYKEGEDSDYIRGVWALRHWDSLYTIIELNGNPVEPVYTMDFEILTEREKILAAVEKVASYEPKTDEGYKLLEIKPHRINVPFDSEIAKRLYAGSGVYLIVPADKRLEDKAREGLKSPDFSLRLDAVRILKNFRSQKNVALLKGLFNDPGYLQSEAYEGQSGFRKFYSVRHDAYQILKEWGEDVEKPVTDEYLNK